MVSPPPVLPNAWPAWLGTWWRPPDRPSQVFLAVAVGLFAVALAPGGPSWLVSLLEPTGIGELRRRRRFLSVTSFVAAFLSLGYIAFYLRGGPRAAEAATYWLQGRALSHGQLAWTAPDPAASFCAKNLTVTAPGRLSGIFPPGYPLLLAGMFLLGAPMLVGPLLAAGLVAATWLLTRELAIRAGVDEPGTERVARIAAGFSVMSAALRYQTADALPHGAAALALTVALACALRGARTTSQPLFGVAGIAFGFLLATQPLSAMAAGAAVLVLVAQARDPVRALAWTCSAALPGAILLLCANRAATGHAFESPGAWHLLSARGAIRVTALRLRGNLADVANFEPIALLPILLLRPQLRSRSRAALLVGSVVFLQLLLLAPFAAGGEVMPGAGARALAEILPIEHALVALTLALSFSRRLPAVTTAAFGLAVGGFALHASYDHERLAASGLGRPHYEPDIPREAAVTHGLLFFDDDEGFELAYHPGVLASHGIVAVRTRNDDHDRLVYDLLGHPPSHRYTTGPSGPSISWWTPTGNETWRFEAESDSPPVARLARPGPNQGPIESVVTGESCASSGRVLTLEAPGTADASAALELPVPHGTTMAPSQTWIVTPRAFQRGGPGTADLTLVTSLGGAPIAHWSWADAAPSTPRCDDLPSASVELGGDRTHAWLVMTARGGSVALDKTSLKRR